MPSTIRAVAALSALFLAGGLATVPVHAAPSSELSVSGAVSVPATYGPAGLAALPAVTQTVSFGSGGGTQTHTYVGTSLWGVLDTAGIRVDPAVKNDVLDKYVLATGSDGYRTVFSLGELDPAFGNRPDLIAYAEDHGAGAAPLGDDGFARLTAPGDVKGGRYVANLARLDVRDSGAAPGGAGGGMSTQFSVGGAVTATQRFDLAALKALPTQTEAVGGHLYTGVSFWDLLSVAVGIALDPLVKNDILDKYVVATGSDGYRALFSLGELSPSFGNQPDLIAFDVDGGGLGADGFARLVVPDDAKRGRWVSNLVSLEVFSAAPVPEPQGAALMLAGLLAVAAASRHRPDRPERPVTSERPR